MGAKLKWGILGGIGVCLTILGFGLGFGAFPVLIKDQVLKNLDLFDEESEGRENFVRTYLMLTVNNLQSWKKGYTSPDFLIYVLVCTAQTTCATNKLCTSF